MTTTIQPAFDGAERLPLPPRDTWTAAQAEAAKELVAVRTIGGAPSGCDVAETSSPEPRVRLRH